MSPADLFKWIFSVLLCAGSLFTVPVSAQVTGGGSDRSPELNLQYHRAEAAWRSGANMLEAKARVDRVLRELPDDIEARKLRAHVFLAMKRFEEALVDSRHAARLNPRDAEAHLLVSEVARAMGDTTTSLEALGNALAVAGERASVLTRISWNASHLEQFELAESIARRALALESQEPSAYYQLARVLVQRDRADEAAAVLERGLRATLLDPISIEKDVVLSRLIDHPLLSPFIRH
jgi:tetratricopeptide (TPR) repeat protein